ncbi:ABC transporter family G domain [Dillenia turbinata]|uniref:ABC transporter family G domain n=1 Tax=Dillenia turbinata TaxID=194707 RepID=A0AAN8ZMT8_9MAGN
MIVNMNLQFDDVKYKATVSGVLTCPDTKKFILHGVTGSVHPGEILALMGPSGGGKTTLLNILGGRIKVSSGTITYNDQPYTKSLTRRIGFVQQDDIVSPHLTVKETLTYAALLRLPNTLTNEQKKERAMTVICELGLERCQNTLVGGSIVRGISGGERKRVCIGIEILLNPSLLFLDEPTSGLDSTTALRIVQMLHNIADAGKTVVTTIHQPSSRLFSKFDKLVLLGKGSSLYFGKASEAMLYFSSIGCSPLIAMNPAEFLIDIANGNMNDKSVPSELTEDRARDKTQEFQTTYERPSPGDVHEYFIGAYEARVANKKKTKPGKALERKRELKMQGRSKSRDRGATWWEQFLVLIRRGFKERRHEYFSKVRIIQVISTAVIVGLLWWHSDASSSKGLQDQANLFHGGIKPSFSAFALSTFTVFLSIVAAQGLGLSIGAAFMDVKKATTFASILIMAFMLSGGFFIQNVPTFMSWLRFISFNYHTYRLLLNIQYGCSGGSIAPASDSCELPLIKGLKLGNGWMEVAAMVTMIVGYRILAYFFLGRMKPRTLI